MLLLVSVLLILLCLTFLFSPSILLLLPSTSLPSITGFLLLVLFLFFLYFCSISTTSLPLFKFLLLFLLFFFVIISPNLTPIFSILSLIPLCISFISSICLKFLSLIFLIALIFCLKLLFTIRPSVCTWPFILFLLLP